MELSAYFQDKCCYRMPDENFSSALSLSLLIQMRREPHEFTIAPRFLKQQSMFFSSLFNRQLHYRSGRLDFLCMCMHAHVPFRTATTWMLGRRLLIKLLNIYFFANPSFITASNKHKNMTHIKINEMSCKSPYLSAGRKIKII